MSKDWILNITVILLTVSWLCCIQAINIEPSRNEGLSPDALQDSSLKLLRGLQPGDAHQKSAENSDLMPEIAEDVSLLEQTVTAGGPGLNGEDCNENNDCQSSICVWRDSAKRRRTCSATKLVPGSGCAVGSDCLSGKCAKLGGISFINLASLSSNFGSMTYCALNIPGAFINIDNTRALDLEACDVDAVCASKNCGYINGEKKFKRCIPSTGLTIGSSCGDTADCKPLTCVVRSASDKTSYCVTKGKDYELCDTDADCQSSNCAYTSRDPTRRTRRCIPATQLEAGRACSADNDCASKNCQQAGGFYSYCSSSLKLVATKLNFGFAAVTCAAKVAEGKSFTLRCGSGQTITAVSFASYGKPDGTCDSVLTIDRTCNAPNSKAYVESHCLKKSSCTVKVGNGVGSGRTNLNDPCPGKNKFMTARVTCSRSALVATGARTLAAGGGGGGGGGESPDGEDPTLTGCTIPAIPSNGVLGDCQTAMQDGGTCSISCNPGFKVDGAPYSCAGSTRSGSQSCVAEPCPVPFKPEVGSYLLATCPVGPDGKVKSGDTCALVCDKGYHVAGAPVPPQTCQNGIFTGDLQVCEGDNCVALVAEIQNGNQGTCGVTVAAKATCSIACATGYHVEPAGDRTCTAGSLSGSQQSCVGNPCPAIAQAPANGNLGTCSRQIGHGEPCTIGCNPGYKLVGAERLCTAGNLGGDAQTCVGLPCTAATRALENGGLGSCASEIAHGTSCKYTCNPGYELVGDALSCTATVLSQDNMVCKGLPCAPRQTPPENGGLGDCGAQIPHGTTCSFSCKDGYHVVGASRTCTATTLSGVDQKCEGDPCDGLKLVPINGQLGDCGAVIGHDSKCQIQCDTGYHVEGDSPSCFAGQLKVQVTPVCIGNPCPPISPLPPHALPGTCGVEVLHGATCSLECEFGWLGRGPNERQCFAGSFQGEAQRCIKDPGPDVLDKLDEHISNINKMTQHMEEMKLQAKVEDYQHQAIEAHGKETLAAEHEKLVPLWQKEIRGLPQRSYQPIDIQNRYTYNRVYMPPETNTDEAVLKKGDSLAKSAEALHAQRVEAMESKCKENTCDVTADSFKTADTSV